MAQNKYMPGNQFWHFIVTYGKEKQALLEVMTTLSKPRETNSAYNHLLSVHIMKVPAPNLAFSQLALFHSCEVSAKGSFRHLLKIAKLFT